MYVCLNFSIYVCNKLFIKWWYLGEEILKLNKKLNILKCYWLNI